MKIYTCETCGKDSPNKSCNQCKGDKMNTKTKTQAQNAKHGLGEARANARLIASAPALLSACIASRAIFEQLDEPRVYKMLNDAIKQAIGEA